MRTLVDIPEDDLKLLKELSAKEGVSQAELVRRAIEVSLAPHRAKKLLDGFGLWAGKAEDGLAYQERMRNEWSDREGFSTPTS